MHAEKSLSDIVHIDPTDIPFVLPPARTIAVDLPWPPSVNSIWRTHGNSKVNGTVASSPKYLEWKRAADQQAIAMATFRGLKMIKGPFEARIVLERTRRGGSDLDNRVKVVLDWAQSREMIENDRYCERLTVEWGETLTGCRLVLKEWGA